MVADDADPTLRIVAPGYGDDGAFQVIFPEHVTVRARGNDEATHVYLWQPGQAGKPLLQPKRWPSAKPARVGFFRSR